MTDVTAGLMTFSEPSPQQEKKKKSRKEDADVDVTSVFETSATHILCVFSHFAALGSEAPRWHFVPLLPSFCDVALIWNLLSFQSSKYRMFILLHVCSWPRTHARTLTQAHAHTQIHTPARTHIHQKTPPPHTHTHTHTHTRTEEQRKSPNNSLELRSDIPRRVEISSVDRKLAPGEETYPWRQSWPFRHCAVLHEQTRPSLPGCIDFCGLLGQCKTADPLHFCWSRFAAGRVGTVVGLSVRAPVWEQMSTDWGSRRVAF